MATRVLGFEKRANAKGVWYDYVQLTASSNITENGNVAVATWWRIKDIEPRDGIDPSSLKGTHMRAMWSVIGPAYDAWKAGNELPETGTPLAAWSGVSQDQAGILRKCGIRTIEDMRDAGDALIGSIPLPGARDLKRMAGEWLAGKGQADMMARVADLEAQNAAMVEMLAEREPTKRGPGRPKKEEAA